jgi:hypothetical protein
MMLRIIHGKLKPGTWDSYERAYKDIMAKAGKIPGLRGRWLAHASNDPRCRIAGMIKILLQQYLPTADSCTAAKRRAAYHHCGAKLHTDDCRYAGCGTHASSLLRYVCQEAL